MGGGAVVEQDRGVVFESLIVCSLLSLFFLTTIAYRNYLE